MLSILEVPAVRRQVAPISVETYHALGEQGLIKQNTELLRGVIIEKTRKSPGHVYVTTLLYELIRAAVGPRLVVRKEDPLTLADSEPEPDIAVVADSPDDYGRAHPRTALLVVEVAVSTVEVDREKAGIYAEAGVAEYWLVLADSATIEVFTQPEGPAYRTRRVVRRDETLASTALPELRVSLEKLFA
jgi:Uma2 family endonuclease